jgi:hypothetical protein
MTEVAKIELRMMLHNSQRMNLLANWTRDSTTNSRPLNQIPHSSNSSSVFARDRCGRARFALDSPETGKGLKKEQLYTVRVSTI